MNSSTSRSLLQARLASLIGTSIALTLFVFYLGRDGQVNSFPTYLTAVVVLIYICVNRRPGLNFPQLKLFGLTAVFLVFLAATELVSDPGEFWRSVSIVLLILGFLYGYSIFCQAYPVYHRLTTVGLLVVAGISCVISIYLDATYGYRPHVDRMSAFGRLDNPVVGAQAYGVGVIIGFFEFMSSRSWKARLIWGLVTCILLAGIVKTGSLGVWGGLSFAFAILVLVNLGYSTSKATLIGTISVAAILIIVGIFWLMQPEWMSSMFPRGLSYRLEIWRDVISMMKGWHLLWGFGNSVSPRDVADFRFDHAHSVLFSTMFHGGLIALFLLVGLVSSVFYVATSQHSGSLSIALLVFGIAVLLVDGDQLLVKVNIVWIIFWYPVARILYEATGATPKGLD